MTFRQWGAEEGEDCSFIQNYTQSRFSQASPSQLRYNKTETFSLTSKFLLLGNIMANEMIHFPGSTSPWNPIGALEYIPMKLEPLECISVLKILLKENCMKAVELQGLEYLPHTLYSSS